MNLPSPMDRYAARHLSVCALLMGSLLLSGCGREQVLDPVFLEYQAMGTVGTVGVQGAEDDRAELVAHLVKDRMSPVHRLISPAQIDNEVTKVNEIAHTVRMPISRDTFRILHLSKKFNELSESAFDITTGPVRAMWGFGDAPPPEAPLPLDVTRAALGSVGTRFLRLQKGTVELLSPYTKIDLWRYSRAYGVDVAVIKLRGQRIENVLVELDGNSRCLGEAAPNRPWEIPLIHALDDETRIGSFHISGSLAVATVKLYDDFVTIQGRKYSRIIDPRTGQPANAIASASVISTTATEANALAHALVVLGLEEGPGVLPNFPKCSVLLIPNEEAVTLWMTPRMHEYFKPIGPLADAVRTIDVPHGGEDEGSSTDPG